MILRRQINNFTKLQDAARSSRKESASSDCPTDKQPCPKRATFCPMASPNTVQHGYGKIVKIDSDTKSMTVELSMSNAFMINLKGILSPDVRFDFNGRLSNILDFNIGDTVTIDWRNTQDGATILALIPDRSEQIIYFTPFGGNDCKNLVSSGISKSKI
jgi:hypothetical protein